MIENPMCPLCAVPLKLWGHKTVNDETRPVLRCPVHGETEQELLNRGLDLHHGRSIRASIKRLVTSPHLPT